MEEKNFKVTHNGIVWRPITREQAARYFIASGAKECGLHAVHDDGTDTIVTSFTDFDRFPQSTTFAFHVGLISDIITAHNEVCDNRWQA